MDMTGRRRVCFFVEDTPAPDQIVEVAEAKTAPAAPQTTIPATEIRNAIKGSGSHSRTFKRSRGLTDHEKMVITVEFLKLNGVLDPKNKDCTRIRNLLLNGTEVSVWQVSGYIFTLHQRVQSGEFLMRDKAAYDASLEAKREQWVTWNGAKAEAIRARRAAAAPEPNFTVHVRTEKNRAARHKVLR